MSARLLAGPPVLSIWVLLLLLVGSAEAQPPLADGPEALYDRYCTTCHNADGSPKKIAKNSPRFTDPAWTATLEKIEQAIINGKGDMPKFKTKLQPKQIRALAEYVSAFRTATPR